MNFSRSLSGSKSPPKESPKEMGSPSEKRSESVSETPSVHVKLPASFCGIHIFESKDSDDIPLNNVSAKEPITPNTEETMDGTGHVNGTVQNLYVPTPTTQSLESSNIMNGKNLNMVEKINDTKEENLDIDSAGYNTKNQDQIV